MVCDWTLLKIRLKVAFMSKICECEEWCMYNHLHACKWNVLQSLQHYNDMHEHSLNRAHQRSKHMLALLICLLNILKVLMMLISVPNAVINFLIEGLKWPEHVGPDQCQKFYKNCPRQNRHKEYKAQQSKYEQIYGQDHPFIFNSIHYATLYSAAHSKLLLVYIDGLSQSLSRTMKQNVWSNPKLCKAIEDFECLCLYLPFRSLAQNDAKYLLDFDFYSAPAPICILKPKARAGCRYPAMKKLSFMPTAELMHHSLVTSLKSLWDETGHYSVDHFDQLLASALSFSESYLNSFRIDSLKFISERNASHALALDCSWPVGAGADIQDSIILVAKGQIVQFVRFDPNVKLSDVHHWLRNIIGNGMEPGQQNRLGQLICRNSCTQIEIELQSNKTFGQHVNVVKNGNFYTLL